MISSFWATAGGWTQRYLENIFNKVSNNDSYNNNYVTNNDSHYQTVASAAQNGDLINIVDDRSTRKSVYFNNSINKRVIILRLDDVQAFAWGNISMKITDSVLERNMSITLGVIPRYIKDDKMLFEYLKNVSNDKRIEIAQHGVNHSFNEYQMLTEDEAFKITNSSIVNIAEISGRYPMTLIPPYNSLNNTAVSRALMRLGFKIISNDYGVFNYDGYIMNIGYSTTTSTDAGLVPVKDIINECNMALNKTRICVITIHPQDYATDKNLLDTEKFSTFINLLDALKEIDAKSITFAELSKDEYTEGGIINNVEQVKQGNVGEWNQDYVYSTDVAPSWTFGNCDCDRIKIMKHMLPTGDDEQDKRINYLMEIIAWDYKFNTVNEMWNYCIKKNFDMNSSI